MATYKVSEDILIKFAQRGRIIELIEAHFGTDPSWRMTKAMSHTSTVECRLVKYGKFGGGDLKIRDQMIQLRSNDPEDKARIDAVLIAIRMLESVT